MSNELGGATGNAPSQGEVQVKDQPAVVSPLVDDPLSPDAPIHQLLSIRHNPLVANMTTEELGKYVQKLRTLATSAPSLSSKLKSDSDNVSTRKPRNTANAKRKALLDDL